MPDLSIKKHNDHHQYVHCVFITREKPSMLQCRKLRRFQTVLKNVLTFSITLLRHGSPDTLQYFGWWCLSMCTSETKFQAIIIVYETMDLACQHSHSLPHLTPTKIKMHDGTLDSMDYFPCLSNLSTKGGVDDEIQHCLLFNKVPSHLRGSILRTKTLWF